VTPLQPLRSALIALAIDDDLRAAWDADPAAVVTRLGLSEADAQTLREGGADVLRLIGRAMGGAHESSPPPRQAPAPTLEVPRAWRTAADTVRTASDAQRFDAILDLLSVVDPNTASR